MLFEKNYQLYLKHETMLDEEKQRRQSLADDFQGEMAKVQEVLNKQKEQRNVELEENKAIREKIRVAIE